MPFAEKMATKPKENKSKRRTSKATILLESIVKGRHQYLPPDFPQVFIGDVLDCELKPFMKGKTVEILKKNWIGEQFTIGHAPKEHTKELRMQMEAGATVLCRITGNLRRGEGSQEVQPCKFIILESTDKQQYANSNFTWIWKIVLLAACIFIALVAAIYSVRYR